MVKKVIGVCNWCKEEKELCKAHLFPKWAYKKDGSINRFQTVSEEGIVIEQNGVKDKAILCSKCDGTFLKKYDDMGLLELDKIILNKDIKRTNNNSAEFLLMDNVNNENLILFMLSVIWRVSISKSQFPEVSLGPLENRIFKILKEPSLLNNKIQAGLLKYTYNKTFGFTLDRVLTIVRGKYSNGSYYQISMYGIGIFLKISENVRFNSNVHPCPISKDSLNTLIIFIDYSETGDFQLALDMVKFYNNKDRSNGTFN